MWALLIFAKRQLKLAHGTENDKHITWIETETELKSLLQ